MTPKHQTWFSRLKRRPSAGFHIAAVTFAALAGTVPFLVVGFEQWRTSRQRITISTKVNATRETQNERSSADQSRVKPASIVSELYYELLREELSVQKGGQEIADAARVAIVTKTFRVPVNGEEVGLHGARSMTLITNSYVEMTGSITRAAIESEDTLFFLSAARDAAARDALKLIAASQRKVTEPGRVVTPPQTPRRRSTKPRKDAEPPQQKPPAKP